MGSSSNYKCNICLVNNNSKYGNLRYATLHVRTITLRQATEALDDGNLGSRDGRRRFRISVTRGMSASLHNI